MPRFRKKPVVIEAICLPAANDAFTEKGNEELHRLLEGHPWEQDRNGGINIQTLEGVMHASPGDWIIRGVKGEVYPCKPDIFDMTYESVD